MSKEIKKSVLDLSTAITGGIKADSKTGQGEVLDNDLYEKHLPEKYTMEDVKAISDYNTDFVAAGTHAWSTTALEAMKENPELHEATISIPMCYKGNLSVTVEKSQPKGDGFVYGVVTPTLTIRAGENGNQMKIVKNVANEMYSEAFKNA